MKKFFLSIIILSISASLALSQEKSMMETLESRVWRYIWKHEDPQTEKPTLITFKNDTVTDYGVSRNANERIITKSLFYLSDTPDEKFDSIKIGKKLNGTYLIKFLLDSEDTAGYEVLFLSDTVLILLPLEPDFIKGQIVHYRPYYGEIK